MPLLFRPKAGKSIQEAGKNGTAMISAVLYTVLTAGIIIAFLC